MVYGEVSVKNPNYYHFNIFSVYYIFMYGLLFVDVISLNHGTYAMLCSMYFPWMWPCLHTFETMDLLQVRNPIMFKFLYFTI